MKQLFTIPIRAAAVLALLPVLQMTADGQTGYGQRTKSPRALLPVRPHSSSHPNAISEPSARLTSLRLEGAWITSYLDDGPMLPPSLPETSLTLFHVDGGLITVMDFANPPGIYGGTEGLGEWANSGDNQFAVTTVFVYSATDAAGNGFDAGSFKQRWSVKYNEARNQLSGPYQWAWIDTDGSVLFEGAGVITLKRIGVEPMSSKW